MFEADGPIEVCALLRDHGRLRITIIAEACPFAINRIFPRAEFTTVGEVGVGHAPT
jgi:hypothetical protein